MNVVTPVATRPRLNPFLFPSDLDFWVILLIAAIVSASLDLFAWIHLATISQAQATQAACLRVGLPTSAADAISGWLASLEQCQGTFDHQKALWMFGGALLVLAVATILYLLTPAYKIWRSGYVPLDPHDAGPIMGELERLCQEAGLRRRPIFLVGPNDAAAAGLAFGIGRRPMVVLKAGLLQRYGRDPASFAAVVRHELGHLRNEDVGKTYFAVAAWWAFLVAGVLPFAIVMLTHLGTIGRSLWDLGWRTAALTLIVYLTRAAVLRQRELYADVRASVWDGPQGALRALLDRMKPMPVNVLRRGLANHPAPEDRRQAVDHTDSLLRLRFWPMFGAGLTFAIAFPNLTAMLVAALTGRSGAVTGLTTVLIASVLAALILAPLTVGVVGLGLWRAAFGAMMRGDDSPRIARSAVALTLGTLLGSALAYESAGSLSGASAGALLGYAVLYVVWAAMMIVIFAALLQWIKAGALPWLQALNENREARRGALVGLAIATALISGGLGLLFLYRSFVLLGLQVWGAGQVVIALIVFAMIPALLFAHPLLVPASVSVWAFPMSAALVRSRSGRPPASDLFLDAGTDPPRLPHRVPFRVGDALQAGAVAAVIGWLVLVILALSHASRTNLGIGLTLAALVAPQAIAAAVVARRAPGLPIVHGLLAGFFAGLLLSVGYELARVVLAHVDRGGAVTVASLVINVGLLMALAAGWVTARWARWRAGHSARASPLVGAAWALAGAALVALASLPIGIDTGVIDFTGPAQAAVASPSVGIPRFSGELGTLSSARQFTSFSMRNDQNIVSLNVTCQYAADANPDLCGAAVSPDGSVILFVASDTVPSAFFIPSNRNTGALVEAAVRTPHSLALSGYFSLSNRSNAPGSAATLASLRVNQLFLLQPVAAGS